MIAYDDLLFRIAPQVAPCPRFVMLDALQAVAVDFFRRSEAWIACLVERLPCRARTIELSLDRDVSLVRVRALEIDGHPLCAGVDYRVEPSVNRGLILLSGTASWDRTAYVHASLKPTRTAKGIPEALADEWSDALAYGALAKLASMSGHHVGWTNQNVASLNYELYEQELARARIHMVRQHGEKRP